MHLISPVLRQQSTFLGRDVPRQQRTKLQNSLLRLFVDAVTRKGAFPAFPTFANIADSWSA
jgi:hypothetical protein